MTLPPILCYHKVDTRLELGFTRIGPRLFRRQVEALARLGFRSLGSAELLEAAHRAGRGPGGEPAAPAPGSGDPHHEPRTLAFTFDDGYAALARHAFPVLADHGFRALVFVITDYVGRDNSWDVQYGWRSFPHLSWDELARWNERGIEVHAHGATHARLTWLPEEAAAEELARSREAIAARLGSPPAAIAYPFGAAGERERRLAAQAGYRLGFAGPAQSVPGDPLRLPRLPVYPWDRAGIPLVMQGGSLGAVARWGARATNRVAVGTALFQRILGRRY